MEEHPGDLIHELAYHVGPIVFLLLIFIGFLILYVRALRSVKGNRHRLRKVEGLNRRDRRLAGAMHRRKKRS